MSLDLFICLSLVHVCLLVGCLIVALVRSARSGR